MVVPPFGKSKLVRLVVDRSGELLYGMARVKSTRMERTNSHMRMSINVGMPEHSGFEKSSSG